MKTRKYFDTLRPFLLFPRSVWDIVEFLLNSFLHNILCSRMILFLLQTQLMFKLCHKNTYSCRSFVFTFFVARWRYYSCSKNNYYLNLFRGDASLLWTVVRLNNRDKLVDSLQIYCWTQYNFQVRILHKNYIRTNQKWNVGKIF